MILTHDELIEKLKNNLVREHLGQNVEFKRSWADKHGPKISGLANKVIDGSSWFIIGIEDDGTFSEHDEKWAITTEEVLSQHLNANLEPLQTCKQMYCHEINGSWLIIIEIICPGAVTFWNKKAFKMSGTTAQEMQPDEVMALTMQLPGLNDFSRQPFQGTIDLELASTFVNSVILKRPDLAGTINKEDPLAALNLIRIISTNTVRILFGDYKYRVVFYDASDTPVVNENRTGLFGLLTNTFYLEIQNWGKTKCQLNEDPFPERALKEALANCVAHAAYFHAQGELIIEIFPQKISLSNLCLPESGHFANKWFSRSHFTINPLLMETLRLAGYVDELGRGKNLIFSESIKHGKEPPIVHLEKSGRFNRWRLFIYGSKTDSKHIRLLERIKKIYPNEQKALLSLALVLWRKNLVATIKTFIDGESAPLFVEVLNDINGPVFYYQPSDKIVLKRWVQVLIEEGKDSKSLSPEEEENLYDYAYDIQSEFHGGYISPKEIRRFARMSESKSEKVLSSSILIKWSAESKVEKISHGKYRFLPKTIKSLDNEQLLKILLEKTTPVTT